MGKELFERFQMVSQANAIADELDKNCTLVVDLKRQHNKSQKVSFYLIMKSMYAYYLPARTFVASLSLSVCMSAPLSLSLNIYIYIYIYII